MGPAGSLSVASATTGKLSFPSCLLLISRTRRPLSPASRTNISANCAKMTPCIGNRNALSPECRKAWAIGR